MSNNDMNARESDNIAKVKISREIPLWGLVCTIGSIVLLAFSVYAGYLKTVDAVEKLSVSVEKLKDNSVETTIRYNQHDQTLNNHGLQLQKIERDIEDLKNRQRWTPR